MTLAFDYPPIPGTWADRAQDALNLLSTMSTPEEVTATFGSARSVVEPILGTPVGGGAGTRRAIRATGRLLTHQQGPALAAEALSWAASITGAADPSTIEWFLEEAATADVVHRPLRLDDRDVLVDHVNACTGERARRTVLRELWSLSAREVDRPDEEEDAWWRDLLLTPIAEVFDAGSPKDQEVAFGRLGAAERAEVARRSDLFDLPDVIVGQCLLEHPNVVLSRGPAGLRNMIRYPYDEATLEVAIRAGSGYYESGRVRRLLLGADATTVERWLATIAGPYLTALWETGIANEEDIVGLLISHPLAPTMASTLGGRFRNEVMPQIARRLIDEACQEIAVRAMRALPEDELSGEDATLAVEAGAFWAARCPGVPATERPVRKLRTIHELGDDGFEEGIGSAAWRRRYGASRIYYPAEIEALEQPYPEAPDWTVTLPATPLDLERNAKLMRNCTMSYLPFIASGDCYILIVHDPQGRRFNVAVERRGVTYRVTELNSWANRGERPSWIAPAMEARMANARKVHDIVEPPVRVGSDRAQRGGRC